MYVEESIIDLRKEPRARTTGIEEDPLQETQLLRGERVEVLREEGDWLYVEALDQPFYDDASDTWRGYRGYVGSGRGFGDLLANPRIPGLTPMAAAAQFLDMPYFWGGMGIEGIDCSGLTHLAYRQAGSTIPRNAHHQYLRCKPINDPLPGDLVFFSKDGQKMTHVLMVYEPGLLIEATTKVNKVRTIPLAERIQDEKFVFYGRPVID